MKKTLLTALLTLPLLTAVAQDRYSESFGAPEGGLPEGWVVQRIGDDAIAEVRATENSRVAHALLIERPGQVSTNAAVFFNGTLGNIANGRVADVSLSISFRIDGSRPTNSSSRGVVLRADKMSYNKFNGYYVAVQGAGERRELAIYWNPQTHINHGDAIAQTKLEKNLEVGKDYQLAVSAKGNSIEAKLYATEASGARGALIAETQTHDATKTEGGYLGIRGAYGNSGPVGTWFHSLHLSAVE